MNSNTLAQNTIAKSGHTSGDKFARQSFLGIDSQSKLENCTVGIVGAGGGGSHIVQQLAHLGFRRYVIYDHDVVEDTNLNRVVGANEGDVRAGRLKIEIARRAIKGLSRKSEISAHPQRWQDNPAPLRGCDIVFGCVDTFKERHELEACCRRYLIPYIDIGMDVHQAEGEPPVMAGQVILSLPNDPCLFCLGFLTEKRLAQEAALYGATGGRPQVVWPNGILASTAIGIAVNLLTDWSRSQHRFVYLQYDGASGTVMPHARVPYLQNAICRHYPTDQVGEPRASKL